MPRIDNLPSGITLIRHPLINPDELGTAAQWQREIDGLFGQLPFPDYWKGLQLSIWHMSHPDLQKNLPNLRDYDTNTPGCQVASGLYYGGKRLDLGVFPDRWSPTEAGPTTLTEANRQAALRTLSHEIGHMHHDVCGFTAGRNAVGNEITRLFRSLRPNQTGSEYEDWAETYRAVMGADGVRGFFSDNKPFTPQPALLAFMKGAYWLSAALAGKAVHSMSAAAGYVQWGERVWWWDNWFRLNVSTWQVEKWTGTTWIKA